MRIGTASVRRRAQLIALEPELSIEPLRGNVDTRLRKRGERPLGGALPAVLAVGEPRDAALLHQRLAALGLELAP